MVKCAHIYCENEFLEKSNKQYCSRQCKSNARHIRSPEIKARKRLKKRPYTQYKKNHCEYCNFIPIHECQLDVDHIDGNHENNDINNLQTLCANCHRLKTYLNNDWH